MKLPKNIKIFGDINYRGNCPPESAEQITAINYIRKTYPQVIHPRNEGKRHHNQVARQKAEGMTTGASDIIIPACPAFVCEIKRQDHTKSRLEKEQIDYLEHCQRSGAFACIALGVKGVIEALEEWEKTNKLDR
jgi:hypothetical protein